MVVVVYSDRGLEETGLQEEKTGMVLDLALLKSLTFLSSWKRMYQILSGKSSYNITTVAFAMLIMGHLL